MDDLLKSLETANLAGWMVVVMGAVVCAAMGWSAVYRSHPVQLIAAAGTVVSSGIIGRWSTTDYYLSFLIVSASCMAPAIIAHVTRSRLAGEHHAFRNIDDRTVEQDVELRLVDHGDDDRLVLDAAQQATSPPARRSA